MWDPLWDSGRIWRLACLSETDEVKEEVFALPKLKAKALVTRQC